MHDEEFDVCSLDGMSELVCSIRWVRAGEDATSCYGAKEKRAVFDLEYGQTITIFHARAPVPYVVKGVHAYYISFL